MNGNDTTDNGGGTTGTLFSDESAGETAYWSLRMLQYGLGSLGMFQGIVIVLLITTRLQECRNKRMVWLIGMNAFWFLLCNLTQVYSYFVNTTNGCKLIQQITAVTYLLMSFFGYLILLTRAKATLAGDTLLIRLHFFATIMLYVGMAGIIIYTVLVVDGVLLYKEHHCTLIVPMFPSWLFLVLDSSLSLILLILFVIPLQQLIKDLNAEEMKETMSPQRDLMRTVVKRNFTISSIQIATTFITMLQNAIITSEYNMQDSSLSFLLAYQQCIFHIDIAINSFTVLFITNIWIPKRYGRLQSFFTRKRKLEPTKFKVVDGSTNVNQTTSIITLPTT